MVCTTDFLLKQFVLAHRSHSPPMPFSVYEQFLRELQIPTTKRAGSGYNEPESKKPRLVLTTGTLHDFKPQWWDERKRKWKGGFGIVKVSNGKRTEIVFVNKSSYGPNFNGKAGDEVDFLRCTKARDISRNTFASFVVVRNEDV